MSGFSNPIIGGGGSLVYPAIKSPNFVQSPLRGWSIDKDGNAYFQTVTIGGGVVRVTFASAAPSSPASGDVWFDTANGTVSYWDGSAWANFQYGSSAIAPGAIGLPQLGAAVTARSLGGITTTIAAAAPAAPVAGDIWIDSANGYQLQQYSGSAWSPITFTGSDVLASGSVGQAQLSSAITARSLGGITTTIAAAAPASPVAGDIWIDSANGYQLQQYSGSAWSPVSWTATDVIAAGTIDASLIAAATITGSLIAAGTITAGNIQANTITAGQIAAATITAAQIAAHTITAAQIQAGTITTTEIAAGTIAAGNIQSGTITAALLAAGIVVAGIVDGTTISGAQIVAHGASGEILVYSGTPAAGNLIESISGASGTDAYGNNYITGIATYSDSLGLAMTISAGSIIDFYTGSLTGGWVQQTSISYAAAGNVVNATNLNITNKLTATGGTAASPTLITTDSLHSLGALGVSGISTTRGWYRLGNDGLVQLYLQGSATGTVAQGTATFPNVLPVGYRPAVQSQFPVLFGRSLGYLSVDTSGNVSLGYPALSSGNGIGASAFMAVT